MTDNVEEFKQHILAGKTIKELQDIYGWSRSRVTEFKRAHGLVGLSPNSKKLDRESGIKKCNSCSRILPLSEFYSNGKTSTGLIKYKPCCTFCENTSRKSNFEELIRTYLETKNQKYECVKCLYTGIFGSLDFHHRNPLEKDFSIGESSNTVSIDKFISDIVPELEKCDLLCPNCHRQEHLMMGLKGFDWAKSKDADNPAMRQP